MLHRENNRYLVRVFSELCQVNGIRLTSVVTVRTGKARDHIDSVARHQFPYLLPTSGPLLQRENSITPFLAPLFRHHLPP
jgi:hypothetical protein